MFEGKTLIGLGCSFTFGEYQGDINTKSCHERSWVKKLEKLGNFKNSVNLSFPGGSNLRSERVLFEYLKNNKVNPVIIFTITELSRFETFNVAKKETIRYQPVGAWSLVQDLKFPDDPKRIEYLKYYFTACSDDDEDVRIINRKIVLIHALLKSLNIEHYFLEMIPLSGTIERNQLEFKIPFIEFNSKNNEQITAYEWVNEHYSLGSCGHW